MNSKIYSTVAIVVMILALIAGAVVLTVYFTVGFGTPATDEPTPQPEPVGFSVTLNDKSYTENTGGLVLGTQNNITVDADGEYIVAVTAVVPSSDFELRVGSERWQWSEITSFDLTGCFDISVAEDSFTLGYTDFATLMGKAFGVSGSEIAHSGVPEGDVFAMSITTGGETLTLGFRFEDFGEATEPEDPVDPDDPGGDEVTGITLDQTQIIF